MGCALHCHRMSVAINAKVALPPGLDARMVARAVGRAETEAGALVEIYAEQRNVFSTIVGIFGARALAAVAGDLTNPYLLAIRLSRRARCGHGHCKLTTTTRAGTSFGVTWLIPA